MLEFAKGQELLQTTLAAETTPNVSLEALLKTSSSGRVVVAPADLVDWQARVSDYSNVVGPAQAGRFPPRTPQAWWHSRLRTPQLSVSILQDAVYVGDCVLVTAQGKHFEYSFPRYNRAPTDGAVVSKSLEGFHFASDVLVDRTIDGLSFVIGDLPGQFGHFVLEVFSRVWALKLIRASFPDVPIKLVAFAGNLKPWQREFLALSDWARDDLVLLDEPARFEAAIIASPAYVLHAAVSVTAAAAFAAIARSAEPAPLTASRRLYISRSRWPKLRRLEDELRVEQLFAERGFDVVHPQTLSIREQVALAHSAKSLCGPVGSAMYLAAFQQPGAANFLLAPEDFALPDDRMLAHLTGAQIAYFFGSGGRLGAERAADWQLDLDGLGAALDRWLTKTAAPPGREIGRTMTTPPLPSYAEPKRLSPAEPSGIKKISVGCGPNHIRSDWWNVDIQRFEGIDETLDATEPWPWTGLDFVFAEHFLEHLALEKAIAFVRHAASALKVGGRLRLSTPSLEYVLKTHFSFESSEDRFNQTLGLNRAFHGWGHQFLYSREVLERLCVDSKLVDVKFFDYGQSDTPELRGLEQHKNGRGSRFGFPGVWIVEATRGEAAPGMDPPAFQVYRDIFIRYSGKH